MKTFNIIYLGLCTILLSCTGGEYFDGSDIFTEAIYDVADIHYDNNTYFTPPEWIIGSWSDEFYIINWAFTSDNAVFSTSGTPIRTN